MNNKGRDTTKGIIYQQWAAMALFLQYLRNEKFNYIHLEAPGSQDFDLVFTDNKKIICEAKDWSTNFSCTHLLPVLKNISKKKSISENDEILLVGSSISDKLINDVENYKYWPAQLKSSFKQYSAMELELLPRVRFWQINKANLQRIGYALFAELVGIWLPEEDLKDKVKSILIDKVFEKAAGSSLYTKTEFLAKLKSISLTSIRRSTIFNKMYRTFEEQFSNIIEDIKKHRKPRWGDYERTALTAQPDTMFFVLDQIKKEKIDLSAWSELWEAVSFYPYYFRLFDIFDENIDVQSNQDYILSFIKKKICQARGFYGTDFFETDIVKLISKIIEQDKKFLDKTLEVTRELLAYYEKDDYFYIKNNRDIEYRKKEVCGLLHKIYGKGNNALKKEIYELIINSFNLVQDEGEFYHYIPRDIFDILYEHLISDWKKFEEKFIDLSRKLAEQHDKFYKKFGKNVRFKGWDLMGGVSSHWGDSYKVFDKHFVRLILKRSLRDYYGKHKIRAWKFIVNKCIIPAQKVSKKDPDFLNRSALYVVLDRYKEMSKKTYRQAFDILQEFILCRKGIPHKSELIYQALLGDFPEDKKWALVKIVADKDKPPSNPFVGQIVSELADKGHKEAREILVKWIKNPDYSAKAEFWGPGPIQNISQFLDSSLDNAIKMFKEYINGDYFINKLDEFDAYKVAGLLNRILKKKFAVGLEILNEIGNIKRPSKNQQILLCFSFLESKSNKTNEIAFLEKMYAKFIDGFLNKLDNDMDKIYNKLPHSNAREVFVQFAEELAKHKKIKEALRIIKTFVDDKDPFMPGEDPEDRKGQYSKHKEIENGQTIIAISSVRGWCGWALAHCVVLEGRDYLQGDKGIINLVKKLTQDKNHYVKLMACFALSQLVRCRLKHLPSDQNRLFFNDKKETALRMAKKVEKTAFDLLKSISTLSDDVQKSINVQKALAKNVLMTLDKICAINEKDAWKLVNIIKKLPNEVISDTAPFMIYYAEIRKDLFKNWNWTTPGLYDDLQDFDDSKFKILLKETMLKNATTRSAFSWEFYRLTDSALRKVTTVLSYSKAFKMSLKYMKKLISEYDYRTFKNVYRFIEDNITQRGKFDICYNLWKKCLEKERTAMKKSVAEGNLSKIPSWPFYKNDKMLERIKNKKGDKAFLDSLEFLSKYPRESSLGDIRKAVVLLKKFPRDNEQIKRIFTNLVERNSKFYDDRKEWLENSP